VRDFLALDPDVTVYVYDNNSADDTAEIAAEAGAVVTREYRQGKGRVVRSMFRDVDADIYVMVDGDDTYPAEDALAMRRYVVDGSADMVVGDRLSSTYFEENKRPFHNAGNRLVRWLVNSLFRARVHDIMSGCRVMSRTFVKTMPVMSPGFEVETEMTIHALDKGFLLREVPIAYRDRVEGSISKLDTLPDGFRVLRMLVRLFRDYRPMRFFGVVALVLLVPALVMFIIPLDEYFATGLVTRFPTLIVSIALGLASMLSFAAGVLLDSIRAHSRQSYELELSRFAEHDRHNRPEV
jgi:glycosyltransferase involved in cell wall biosynthesis